MENILSVMIAIIELFILLYFFNDFSFNKKSNMYKRLVLYIFIIIISIATWNIFENIFIKFIFINIFLIFILIQIYKESFWVTEFYVITYLLVSLFSEVVIKTNIKVLIYKIYHVSTLVFDFICIVSTKFMTLILLFFLKKVMKKLVLKKTNTKDLGLILIQIITDVLFFIFVGIFINNESTIEKGTAQLIMLCNFLILIFFISGLYYTEYFVKINHRNIVNEEELQLAKMRLEIYRNQIQDADKIRSMYHDMKNHILVLKNKTLESNVYENYLSVLEEKINEFNDYIHTGNQYLDIIIKEKMVVCKEKNIKLDVQINLCKISVLAPLEICILFGNLLDNAIEANEYINNLQERKIEIVAHRKNKSFVIKSVNPIGKPLIWSKNSLVTTKKDKYYHGFGMKNIIKIITEKKGQYSIKTVNNEFMICIIIPMED